MTVAQNRGLHEWGIPGSLKTHWPDPGQAVKVLKTNVWVLPRQPASASQAPMTGTEAGCTTWRALPGREPFTNRATFSSERNCFSERRPGREDGRRDRNGTRHRRG